MLNPIRRVFTHRYLYAIRVLSPTLYNYPCFLQLTQFSSAPKPISEISNQDSFTVSYLTNTFGFSKEIAFSASKYLNIKSPENPDSVIAFLGNHGFTKEQIGKLVRTLPLILVSDPQRTILPKLEFLLSLGMNETQVTKMLLAAPTIFMRSLEKQIIPSSTFVKSLFDSNGTKIGCVHQFGPILCCDLRSILMPNVEILRKAGVPDSRIVYLMQYQPRVLIVETERFREVVEKVRNMGWDPLEFGFVAAIHVFRSMSKSTWESKVTVFKKWGWSEDEILSAFKKNPGCMTKSADEIMKVMNFLVNEMGISSYFVSKRADITMYSLEKRMKPRGFVYKILLEKGLIKKGAYFGSIFGYTERKFLEKFVHCYENKVPGISMLYQNELAVSIN